MESCGFFNSYYEGGQYDRVYNAEQHAQYFASFIGNGVFKYSPILGVEQSSTPSLSITVTPGQAWINGYWYKNDEALQLPIDLPDTSYARIDSVAIRWDVLSRDIKAIIIKGNPSASPVAPQPVRNSTTYDLIIAHINVAKSALRITNDDIIDTRLNFDICGFVYALVDRGEEASLERRVELLSQDLNAKINNRMAFPSNKGSNGYVLTTNGSNGISWQEGFISNKKNVTATFSYTGGVSGTSTRSVGVSRVNNRIDIVGTIAQMSQVGSANLTTITLPLSQLQFIPTKFLFGFYFYYDDDTYSTVRTLMSMISNVTFTAPNLTATVNVDRYWVSNNPLFYISVAK